jgi:hypothetical protein
MFIVNMFQQTNGVLLASLFSHRYLLHKAQIISMHFPQFAGTNGNDWVLEKMGQSFDCEVRCIIFAPPLGLAFLILGFYDVAFGMLFVGSLLVCVTDGIFSIACTVVFLRPITHALEVGAVNMPGYQKMRRRKWTTLLGIALVVGGSSALYVQTCLLSSNPSRFIANPWVNPYIFGTKATSVLRDIGMFMVSGAALPCVNGRRKGANTATLPAPVTAMASVVPTSVVS